MAGTTAVSHTFGTTESAQMIQSKQFSLGPTGLGGVQAGDFSGGQTPLLLIHGVLRRWQDFMPVLPTLAFRHPCFAIDQRGHGSSRQISKEGEPTYRTVDYVDDASALMPNEFAGGAILYGHSLGAMVAAGVAGRCPELVKGIILEDPPFHTMGDRIETTPWASYFQAIRQAVQNHDSTADLIARLSDLEITDPNSGRQWTLGSVRDQASIRFFASCLTRIDPSVLDPICDGSWLADYDLESVIEKIDCPTLLLQADSKCGGMLVDEDVNLFRDQLPDLTHLRFDGHGHSLHTSATGPFMNAVFGFLESL
jgi:pimeloyl-ACP methyl ester carboxylesterase